MLCNHGLSDGATIAVARGAHIDSLEAFRENGTPHELVYAMSGEGSTASIPAGNEARGPH